MGRTKIQGNPFKTVTLIASLKDWGFTDYINSKSYSMAECYSLKIFNFLYTSRHMLTFYFGEDCDQFVKRFEKKALDEKQQRNAVLQAMEESLAQAISSP